MNFHHRLLMCTKVNILVIVNLGGVLFSFLETNPSFNSGQFTPIPNYSVNHYKLDELNLTGSEIRNSYDQIISNPQPVAIPNYSVNHYKLDDLNVVGSNFEIPDSNYISTVNSFSYFS